MPTRTWRPAELTRVAGRALLAFVALVLLVLLAPPAAAAPGDEPEGILDTGFLTPGVTEPASLTANPGAGFLAPAAAPAPAALAPPAPAPAAPAPAAPEVPEIDSDNPGCLTLGGNSPLDLNMGCDSVGAAVVGA